MKIRWLLQACMVVAVGMGLASCTKAEIEQAMNRPAEIMLQSSPCQPAGVASTATPEFCINVTAMQLISRDTQADVSLTLVNRTGRRHFIYVSGTPSMIDSSGTKWIGRQHTGLGSGTHYPVPVEPNVETQGSITFYQSGQATTDLTFSLRGEIAIMQVDSRGQPIPFKIVATRGFNISGIRLPQPPPQSSAPTEQNQDTKLAKVSPPQSVASATPKPPASSQSTASGAIAGASGSGNPNTPEPASPNTSPVPDSNSMTPATSLGNLDTNQSGSRSVGNSRMGPPDVIGLRIGSTLAEARARFKSQILISDNLRKSYVETRNTLLMSLPGGVIGGPVQNGQFVSDIRAGGTHDDSSTHHLSVAFSPIPGQETIVYILRSTSLPNSKRPTLDAFEKSLSEKYGMPTDVHKTSGGRWFYWSYDNNDTLRKPGSINARNCRQNTGALSNGVLNSLMTDAGQVEKLTAQCGDIFLYVSAGFDGNYHGSETLIKTYGSEMTGFDAVRRALHSTKAIVDKASAEASAAAIKKGQQQKPEF